MLQVSNKFNKFYIGILKEIIMQENWVVFVFFLVVMFIGYGYCVVVELGVGQEFSYFDYDYFEMGVDIVYSVEQVYKVDVIIKVVFFMQVEIEFMYFN